MRSCRTTLKPLFRWLAAITVAVFIGAEAMCFVHCHLGGGHGGSGEASCHGHETAAAESGHDEESPSSPKPSPTSSCATLQNLLSNSVALTLVVPDFPLRYTQAPSVLGLNDIVTEPNASISRAARPREWVFTPEVYLGPAIHSLAPPAFS
jgi:hypothetical protein